MTGRLISRKPRLTKALWIGKCPRDIFSQPGNSLRIQTKPMAPSAWGWRPGLLRPVVSTHATWRVAPTSNSRCWSHRPETADGWPRHTLTKLGAWPCALHAFLKNMNHFIRTRASNLSLIKKNSEPQSCKVKNNRHLFSLFRLHYFGKNVKNKKKRA